MASTSTAGGMRRVLALEGNIGAGKSTLLRLLKARGLWAVEEPVARWQSVEDGEGSNLLDMFYRDPKRWAFTFQTYAFLSRTQAAVQQLRAGDAAYYASAAAGPDDAAADGERASEKRIPPSYVFERSLYSDKHCFATNCFKTGLFNQAEWTVYNDYHAFIMDENPCLRVDGFVYLRTAPETCLNRGQRRGRPEEAGVPLSYLRELHARHEDWLLPPSPSSSPSSFSATPASTGFAEAAAGDDEAAAVVEVAGEEGSGLSRELEESPDLSIGVSTDGVPVLVVDCDLEFEGDPLRLEKVGAAIDHFCATAVQPRFVKC